MITIGRHVIVDIYSIHSQVFVGLGVLAVADHLEALGGTGSQPEIFAEIGGLLPQVVARVARRMGAEIYK